MRTGFHRLEPVWHAAAGRVGIGLQRSSCASKLARRVADAAGPVRRRLEASVKRPRPVRPVAHGAHDDDEEAERANGVR